MKPWAMTGLTGRRPVVEAHAAGEDPMGSAEAFELAHYGIVAALADRLGVVEFLDRHVAGASSRQESPGRWAKILLCRATPSFPGNLGCGPTPVNHTPSPPGKLRGQQVGFWPISLGPCRSRTHHAQSVGQKPAVP